MSLSQHTYRIESFLPISTEFGMKLKEWPFLRMVGLIHRNPQSSFLFSWLLDGATSLSLFCSEAR